MQQNKNSTSGQTLPKDQQTSLEDFDPKYFSQFAYRIGLSEFRSTPIVNHKKITHLNHTIIKSLSSQKLSIKDFYQYWRWQYLFKSIKTMAQLAMEIHEHYYRNALKDIAVVEWTKLIKLKLKLSNTTSIEAIAWLNCPNLSTIELDSKIKRVTKPLAKGFFPQLRIIRINCGGLNELELSRTLVANEGQLYVKINHKNVSNQFKHKKSFKDISYLSKIGYIQRFFYDLKAQKTNTKTQSKRIEILEEMKNHILFEFYESGQQYKNRLERGQIENILECLLERRFEVGGD